MQVYVKETDKYGRTVFHLYEGYGVRQTTYYLDFAGNYKGSYVGEAEVVDIEKVIFSGPATIVFWDDGTKTVVKCQEGDNFDYQTGILLCIIKKNMFDNDSGEFNRYIHTNVFGHLPEDNIPDTFDTEE